jgi:hypothetical protein
MLDVCDELGLMLVEESPLRGSEGGEDWAAGRRNMLNQDREQVLRDRNHPAVVIWSAANEWSEPIKECVPLIAGLDPTRPIIADGVGDMGAPYINMEHYTSGMPGVPVNGGRARTDRPYGETEAVWPADNTWQGFAWMATGTRIRRLKGNADIRNYVLNNAWPDYVPGEGPQTEVLERAVKHMGGGTDLTIHEALGDGVWQHPNIRLMQQCYHPLAACDVDFDKANARSNRKGEWPVTKPRLAPGSHVTRTVAVFNDEFTGEALTLRWELRAATAEGAKLAGAEVPLSIPRGEFRTVAVTFDAPKEAGDVWLGLWTLKDGAVRFNEDKIVFTVADIDPAALKDGDYKLSARHSGETVGLAPATAKDPDAPVVHGELTLWRVTHVSDTEITLTNPATGFLLGILGASKDNDARAVQTKLDGEPKPHQIWRVEDQGDGFFVLVNRGSGKVLDVYGRSMDKGGRVVQWDANGGENQQWQFVK